MADITGVSIYSSDSTQTAVSVTIGGETFNYSGSFAGNTYTGPATGAFALDGLDVTITEASESSYSLCVKDSYIHDSEVSDANDQWNGIVHAAGTSVISGSTFYNNKQNNPSGYGRGVVLASGSLWIDNTVFDSNYCKSYGIIYKRATSEMNISGSTFVNNSGAACIITFTKGWLNISGSSAAPTLFIDNPTLAVKSDNAYGWVRISGATFSGNVGAANNEMKMIIESGADGTRTLFTENVRASDGGAVYHANKYREAADGPSWLSVSDAIFDRNVGKNGGALFAGSSFSLTGSTFFGNTASNAGGALYFNGGTGYVPVIADNVFINNNSLGNGGAVYAVGTNANVFSDSYFSANTASSGAGIYAAGNTDVTVTGGTFIGNYASYQGGAVYSQGAVLSVTDSLFQGNIAGDGTVGSAGGAAVRGAGLTLISGSTFTGNTASPSNAGAGGTILNGGTTIVSNSYFFDNTVNTGRGGAIFNGSANLKVYVFGGTISGNRAAAAGGIYNYRADTCIRGYTAADGTVSAAVFDHNKNAVFLNAYGNVSIDSAVFINDTSSAVSVSGSVEGYSVLDISGSTFQANNGAINVTGGTAMVRDSRFLSSTDRIFLEGHTSRDTSLTLSGDIELNASVVGSAVKGAVYVIAQDADFVIGNTSGIALAGMTFSGNNSITFRGNADVAFADQDLSGVNVTIDGTTVAKDFTASGITALDGFTVSGVTLDSDGNFIRGNYRCSAAYAENTLSVTANALVVSDTFTLSDALTAAASEGIDRIIFSDALFSGGSTATLTTGNMSAAAGTFSGGLTIGNAADRVLTYTPEATNAGFLGIGTANVMTLENISLQGFYKHAAPGGAISNAGTATIIGGFISGNTVGNGSGNHYGTAVANTGTLTVYGTTFSDNVGIGKASGYYGGALANTSSGHAYLYDAKFFDNRAVTAEGLTKTNRGTAVLSVGNTAEVYIFGGTFSGNYTEDTSKCGAVVSNESNIYVRGCTAANGDVSKALFDGNQGGVYSNLGTISVADAIFRNNYEQYSVYGADSSSGKTCLIDVAGATFSGNAGAVYLSGATATIADSKFLTATDAITVRSNDAPTAEIPRTAKLTLTGDIELNASIANGNSSHANVVNAVDLDLVLGNTAAINIEGLTFSGSNSMTFNGTKTVNFKQSGGQDLSGVAITVGTGNLPAEGDSFVIASGVSALGPAITVGDELVTLGEAVEISGNTYTFALDGTNFRVSNSYKSYDIVYAVLNGATEVIVSGNTVDLTGDDAFDSIAAAEEHLNPGGRVVVIGATAASNVNNSRYYYVDGEFTAHTYLCSGAFEGGVDLGFERLTMPETGRNLYVIRNNSKDTYVGGDVHITVRDSWLGGSLNLTASNKAAYLCDNVIYDIADSVFLGDVLGGGGDYNPIIKGNIAINLTGSTLYGRVVGCNGNQIAADKTIDVVLSGSTVGGVVKHKGTPEAAATVLAEMTLTVTGSADSVIGSYGMADVDNMVIDAGVRANFTDAQSLFDVDLVVDGSLYAGSDLVVATGVNAVGSYTITNTEAPVALVVKGLDLVMTTVSDVIDDSSHVAGSFFGGTVNVMTGGEVANAFFGTAADSGDVSTTIYGGTIGNAVIGGARVASGATAALDTVTLNIAGGELAGGPDNGGQLYTAGYAYGASESALDANVTLSVAKSELNLAGGSIAAQNLFAGAHARKGAWTHVTDTVVTVTDGTYHRIYGGGWAELNGKSEVGAAAITVSGGTVERIYAGGANAAGGTTVTGSATISVSGNASVDFIFLAGKNANCSVSGDVDLTLSGGAKEIIRISGRNGNGADNTAGVTSLNVQTGVTVHYLDYVDAINVKQWAELSVADMLINADGTDAFVNFELDNAIGTDVEWTALSGAACDAFQNATFAVNGDVVEWKGSGQLGDTAYAMTYDSSEKKFTIRDFTIA